MFVNRRMSLAAAAFTGLVVVAGTAEAATQTAVFDLDDIVYQALVPNVFGSFDTGLPGARILEFGWTDAILEVYDNTGTTNLASQAYLGFSYSDGAGGSTFLFESPGIAAPRGPGVNGPFTGSIDLQGVGMFIADDGILQVAAVSSWNDGSGEYAGMWTSGQFYVTYVDVPAPGVLALLGGAALCGRRRRR